MLGASLCPVLEASGFKVTTQGRSGPVGAVCDLTSARDTGTMLDRVRPEIIVNLAALTSVDRCEEAPNEAYRANVKTVENICRWIARNGGAKLVHISTDQVYDGPGPHEEQQVTLTNYYAFSKYAAELAVHAVEGTSLRTNFFGHSRRQGRQSLSDWLLGALRDKTSINVFTDVMFSPLSLNTLCALIADIAARPVGGVFNLGSRDGMSKADFAYAIAALYGLGTDTMTRAKSGTVKLKAYRPGDMRMNCSLFERTYGVRLPMLAEEIKRLKEGDQ